LSPPITVKQNIAFIVYKLAKIVIVPESFERRYVGRYIIAADKCSEVLGCFGTMIKWHFGEKMVDDVIMSYVVEKETSLPAEKRPVDCSSGTTLEIPLLAPVVRHNGVGVMQVSDHDKPMGHFKPRNAIILDNLSSAPDGTCINNTPDHKCNTNVRDDNGVPLGFRK